MSHNLINGFSELCLINGSFISYCQVFFIGDVYFGKIGERAETLINIHQHMHFVLCILRDKKKHWRILGLKLNRTYESWSNCFTSTERHAANFVLIFFFSDSSFLLEVFNPPFSRPFSRRLFVSLFVIFSTFFIRWLDHYEIETSLPPQCPFLFPFLPISYPWGSFDACLCTQADETQPLTYHI